MIRTPATSRERVERVRKKRREEGVARMLNSRSIRYFSEWAIRFTRRDKIFTRIDVRVLMPFGEILLEVDEKHHANRATADECLFFENKL